MGYFTGAEYEEEKATFEKAKNDARILAAMACEDLVAGDLDRARRWAERAVAADALMDVILDKWRDRREQADAIRNGEV